MHHSAVRVNVAELAFVVSEVWPGRAHGPGGMWPDLAFNSTSCSRCHIEASDPDAPDDGMMHPRA